MIATGPAFQRLQSPPHGGTLSIVPAGAPDEAEHRGGAQPTCGAIDRQQPAATSRDIPGSARVAAAGILIDLAVRPLKS
jgi:hypothetical protein